MKKILFPMASLFAAFPIFAKTLDVSSPDGNLKLKVSDENGTPHYELYLKDSKVLMPSRLGISFKQLGEYSDGFQIVDSATNSHNEKWQLPWGERKEVTDQHNELLVDFIKDQQKFSVRFRLFDNAVGFRYEFPKQKNAPTKAIVSEELTEFVIANSNNTEAWWIPSRGWNRYEYLYENTPLAAIDRVHTPFTLKTKDNIHISIHEAALVDYAAMTLDQRRTGQLKANLTPWSDGDKVKTAFPFNTPWRTVQVSDKATGLLNSDIILNLNEPNKLGDVSWVEPAKYVGTWWGMHIGTQTWGSGEKHGATTENTIELMDFAAEHGFAGVLVEGWNIGWDGDWFSNGDIFSFTQSYPDFDIAKVAKHGEKVGVRLIGHHETSGSVTNYRNQMEDAFKLYQKSGVAQVKTGYVADGGNIKRVDENGLVRHEWHDGQFMANEYLHNIKTAAKYKISINTHEPIKDTGLRRTYPNWIAREGARGQEFNAWGTPPNSPSHAVDLVYTRMLSGPMDFTPGIFNLMPNGKEAENRIQTTLTKQLALYVVLYSPIQMAADLPEHYKNHMDAFQFIKDVPTDWNQSIAVAGEVGDFVAFARQDRNSQDWYLGAITDENARDVEVDLDFLDANEKYQAEIYRDGEKADWKTNPYDYAIEKKTVSAKDKLTLKLATSGGTAIRFTPVK